MNQKARIQQISSLLLSFLTIVLISSPSYSSGITSNANSATCNNSTLETYTGTSNLQANWNANTIELHWYSDDTEITGNDISSSCVYSGALTLPPASSMVNLKPGYTFGGWRVRQAAGCTFASQVCSLTGSGVNGLTYNMDDSNAYGYYSHNGQDKKNESTYGLTAGGWTVKDTSGGIIKGIASCNSTKPNLWDTVMEGMSNGTMTGEQVINALWGTCNNDTFKPSNTFDATASGQDSDQYCWCKMESYTPSGESACNIASPSWVFGNDLESASSCALDCASVCADYVVYTPGFRRAVFGVGQ